MSETKSKNTVRKMVLCAMFSALIAVGAFIRVPIPLLPFTLQTLFVMLAGLLLGKNCGALSAFVYMAIGLVGVPVFTQGGGISYIAKPSFGYIIGFVFGAYVIGAIAGKSKAPSFARLFAANLAGLGVIYFVGMVYFYVIQNYVLMTPFGVPALFVSCFLMTIPGDIILAVLSALLARRIIPVINR